MLSQNNNALGIIFPNSYDNTVPELVTERTMASIPFAGRYRMVDFISPVCPTAASPTFPSWCARTTTP